MKTITQAVSSLSFLLIVVFGLMAYGFASGQWTTPPSNPPNANVAAPINVGSQPQVKTGNIGAQRFVANEAVWSDQYCDGSGENCSGGMTALTLTGTGCGGGWVCPNFTILRQTNISHVERVSTGYYRVYFATPMSNTNYTAVVNFNMRGLPSQSLIAVVHGSANVFNKHREYLEIAVGNNHQGGAVQDARGHLDLIVIP